MIWVSAITHCNISKQLFFSKEGLIKDMFFYCLFSLLAFKEFLIQQRAQLMNILYCELVFSTACV